MAAREHEGRVRMRLGGTPSRRGGGLYVSERQRVRVLEAAFAVIAEDGYQGMAVRKVAERAGVSSKTFYDLFSDREDCFLAAFDYGVDQLALRVRPVFEAQRDWLAGVREGLGTLLAVLDREPALRRLVFVEALGVGPRVLARRAEVLQELAAILDRGRFGHKDAQGLPGLTAEGVVGAAFGVVHARLLEDPGRGEASRSRTQGAWRAKHASDRGRRDAPPLADLLGELMAMIVLPYRGRAAAARELTRKVTPVAISFDRPRDGSVRPLGSAPPSDFRLTVRREMVLMAIAQRGEEGAHPNNREVSELVGVADQGQISRLMMRLQEQGLVENTRGQVEKTRGQGHAKAWRLSPRGEEVLHHGLAHNDRPEPPRVPR